MGDVRRLSSNYNETIKNFCNNYESKKANVDRTILAEFIFYTAANKIEFDCNEDKVYSDIISEMFISVE